MQRAMAQSREEEEFRRRVGDSYEQGGGSGSARGDIVLKRMLRRASSTREPPLSVRDYNVAIAKTLYSKGLTPGYGVQRERMQMQLLVWHGLNFFTLQVFLVER